MRILTASCLAVLLVSPLASPPAEPPPFVLMWGSSGSGVGEFAGDKPRPLDVDRFGNVYVVDWVSTPTGMDRVQVFDSTGRFLRYFYAAHPDGWVEGLAVDDLGNVILVNEFCDRVEKYDNSGNLERMWGWGVFNGNSALQVCTLGCQTGISGNGNGQFSYPSDVAVLGDTVYVSDWFNARVQLFSRDGSFQASFGAGSFPAGVDVTPNGDFYVSNYFGHTVARYSSSGTQLAVWGSNGSGVGQFDNPYGVAVTDDGDVFVADSNNHRVQRYGDPPYRTFRAELLRRTAPLIAFPR